MTDPLAKHKKNSEFIRFEDSICKHIEDIERINQIDVQKIFSIDIHVELFIYLLKSSKQITSFDYISINMNSIMAKVVEHLIKNIPPVEDLKKQGIRVRLPKIIGTRRKLKTLGKLFYFIDGIKDGKLWYEHYQKNKYTKTTTEITWSVKFETEEEASNFIKQFDSNFAKYVTNILAQGSNINSRQIIWMGDQINPRTGKKGYESDWTDEDFYKFFNITEEEQKTIEATMEKYK